MAHLRLNGLWFASLIRLSSGRFLLHLPPTETLTSFESPNHSSLRILRALAPQSGLVEVVFFTVMAGLLPLMLQVPAQGVSLRLFELVKGRRRLAVVAHRRHFLADDVFNAISVLLGFLLLVHKFLILSAAIFLLNETFDLSLEKTEQELWEFCATLIRVDSLEGL